MQDFRTPSWTAAGVTLPRQSIQNASLLLFPTMTPSSPLSTFLLASPSAFHSHAPCQASSPLVGGCLGSNTYKEAKDCLMIPPLAVIVMCELG